MIVLDANETSSANAHRGRELKLTSRAVSRGAAIGKIVCLHGQSRQFYRVELKESKIKDEVRRLSEAVDLARRQLEEIVLQNNALPGRKKSGIFETHLMILEDGSLISKIADQIKSQKVNAEWAAKLVLDGYISNYKTISDEHMRDRYIDLEDISERLLNALAGESPSVFKLDKDSVIVAKEVCPSTLIELVQSEPKAIITENGGWTSHTFIIARELGIPAVTGLTGIMRDVQTGDVVIVDGYNGHVILNPSEETEHEFRIAAEHHDRSNSKMAEPGGGPVKTLDGREIIVRANLDLQKDYTLAARFGAQGVGLYRSEYLFNQFKGFPAEAEQFDAYVEIGKLVGDHGVRIRTFDLSTDQISRDKEKNPALGLRGMRLSLSNPQQFRIQLRALLRASAEHPIDIVLPMICDVAELLQAREIVESEKEYLAKRKIAFGNPKIGAMIEVPSAVLTISDIAAEADFLSLGTNDLVQYLLAVDRDNEVVADLFKTLHPAVIKSVEAVLKEAETKGISAIVCGEMAGSPFYVPILIGLGAKELSMNVNSISRIRRTIEGIAAEEARELVDKIKKCRLTSEIETLVRDSFSQKWSHLFTPDILPIK